MSQHHRHAAYFWVAILVVVLLFGFTIFKVNKLISVSKSEQQIEEGFKAIKSHKDAVSILRARNILKEIEVTKAGEFKAARDLCMKDIESVKPSKDHSLIFQDAYCRDRAIVYMGYDEEYKELKKLAVRPLPSSIKVTGVS